MSIIRIRQILCSPQCGLYTTSFKKLVYSLEKELTTHLDAEAVLHGAMTTPWTYEVCRQTVIFMFAASLCSSSEVKGLIDCRVSFENPKDHA